MAERNDIQRYTATDQERAVPAVEAMRAFIKARSGRADDAQSGAFEGITRALAVIQGGIDLEVFAMDYADRVSHSLLDGHDDAWLDGVAAARRVSPWFDSALRQAV